MIHVYIETSIRGPNEKDGYGIAIIEENGNAITTGGPIKSATENKALLVCLKNALRRINSQVSTIIIHTNSKYVEQGLSISGIYQWSEHDWKKSNGKELKYAPHWAAIYEHLIGKEVIVDKEKHSYSKWLQSTLERKEKELKNV